MKKSAKKMGKGILLDLLFLLAEKSLLYPHKLSQHLRVPKATISSPSSCLSIMKNLHTKKSVILRRREFHYRMKYHLAEWHSYKTITEIRVTYSVLE